MHMVKADGNRQRKRNNHTLGEERDTEWFDKLRTHSKITVKFENTYYPSKIE